MPSTEGNIYLPQPKAAIARAAIAPYGGLSRFGLDALARHFLTPGIPDRRRRNAAHLVADTTVETA